MHINYQSKQGKIVLTNYQFGNYNITISSLRKKTQSKLPSGTHIHKELHSLNKIRQLKQLVKKKSHIILEFTDDLSTKPIEITVVFQLRNDIFSFDRAAAAVAVAVEARVQHRCCQIQREKQLHICTLQKRFQRRRRRRKGNKIKVKETLRKTYNN